MNTSIPPFSPVERRLASRLFYRDGGPLEQLKIQFPDNPEIAVQGLIQKYSQETINLKDKNILTIFDEAMKRMISCETERILTEKLKRGASAAYQIPNSEIYPKTSFQKFLGKIGWLETRQEPTTSAPIEDTAEADEMVVLETNESIHEKTCEILENWKKNPTTLLFHDPTKSEFDRIRDFLRQNLTKPS